MSILTSVTSLTTHVADDVRHGLRRARLEGERRLLERRHRHALEELGRRAHRLMAEGTLSADALADAAAEVDARLAAVSAALAAEQEASEPAPVERSADIAFPMVADAPATGSQPAPQPE